MNSSHITNLAVGFPQNINKPKFENVWYFNGITGLQQVENYRNIEPHNIIYFILIYGNDSVGLRPYPTASDTLVPPWTLVSNIFISIFEGNVQDPFYHLKSFKDPLCISVINNHCPRLVALDQNGHNGRWQ